MKRGRILVVTVNITEQTAQLVPSRTINSSAVFFEAVSCPRSKLIETPTCLCHPDNRHVEVAPFDHRLQRRKDFLVGEIAGCTKEDQGIRVRNVHALSPQLPDFSRWPPKPKRIAESSLSW